MIVFVSIILSLTTLTGGTTTGTQHYHIVPVNSTHLCQHYKTRSCLTLDQLSSELNIAGDITLSFLPGDHLLTWNMRISGANEVTLDSEQLDNHSHSLPRITCSESKGIDIEDTKLFMMKELEIHGCRRAGNGGAISFYRTSSKIKTCIFTNNTALSQFSQGGAIYSKDMKTDVSNCSFFNNIANEGGGIYVEGGLLSSSNNVYLHNKAYHSGGGISIWENEALFENDQFQSNQAEHGSAVYAQSNLTFTNCLFSGNLGGKSVIKLEASNAKFTGHSFLMDNFGSLHISYASQIVIFDTILFINNTGWLGGAISCTDDSIITFNLSSQTHISKNKASKGGGIYVELSTVTFYGGLSLIGNAAEIAGGGIYATQSRVKIGEYSQLSDKINISYNVAEEDGGGVYLMKSELNVTYQGITIFGNTARHNGGGMFYSSTSTLTLLDCSNVKLILGNNSARRGGGWYVKDNKALCVEELRTDSECFLKPVSYEFPAYKLTVLFLKNNAMVAGNDIFGGLLDICTLAYRYKVEDKFYTEGVYSGIEYIEYFTAFDWAGNKTQSFSLQDLPSFRHATRTADLYGHVSSDPDMMCFCENDFIDCNTHPTVFKKRGEKFTLNVVAVDQVGKPVNATIISTLQSRMSDTGRIKGEQRFRKIGDQCTTLEYNVYSSYDSVVMELYSNGPCMNEKISKQEVNITFTPCTCPVGFERFASDSNCSCNCDKRLTHYISNCLTDIGIVQIDSNVWIEYVNSTNTTDYITQQCPFDYCVQKPVTLSLTDQDEQCASNRTGTLCGECKEGLSLVFASSNCQQCSNYYLFLILPIALAGIVLVAFILMLNMTVATGTIHGLLFYANILQANRSVFIPSDSPAFLSVFISWLNLDLGIETCFYSGMDSYGKLLLQLVFPAYVFLLIAIIMVLCDCSQRIAGLFGKRNPEATLYTLVLLSYSKLIRLIIIALQFTTISYPDNSQEIVWLYDANVLYFTASHTPRFITAIIITILGAVYTSLLLFGQLFNRCSEYRLMKWTTHKYYIHFLKAHHAPFSDKHRYWVGLLLLIRLAHYLISAFGRDTIIILSASFIPFSLILTKPLLRGRVYRNYWLDSLETLFLGNLCIVAVITFVIKYRYINCNQTALAIASVSVTFIAFLALVLYHILHSCGVRLHEVGKVCRQALSSVRQHRHYQLVSDNQRDEEEDLDDEPLIELGNVENDTDTIVTDPDRYITPPIIRSAMRDDKLREPALDDLIPITPEDYMGI